MIKKGQAVFETIRLFLQEISLMLGVSFPYSSWIASGLSFKKKVAPGHFKETDAQNKKNKLWNDENGGRMRIPCNSFWCANVNLLEKMTYLHQSVLVFSTAPTGCKSQALMIHFLAIPLTTMVASCTMALVTPTTRSHRILKISWAIAST